MTSHVRMSSILKLFYEALNKEEENFYPPLCL